MATVYLTASDVIFAEKEVGKNGENGNSLFIVPEEGIEDGRTAVLPLAYNNFILAESSPYFIDVQIFGVKTEERREDIISYKVQAGENVTMIAEKLGISSDTIRWANNIKGNTVKEGDELLILPITGTIYYVERGDTISEIASMHKTDEREIVAFNNIVDGRISAGERMIIPGGTPPPPPPPPAPSPSSPRITVPQTRVASSGFINPVPGGMITQGIHPYNAVDIYQPCGYPIVAAASGRVIEVSIGTWAGGAGNFVKIDHGEVIAVYSHMQSIYVSTGDYVSQGRQIGTVGNTGRTVGRTGCHLHFDILSLRIRNPFGHLPVGTRL